MGKALWVAVAWGLYHVYIDQSHTRADGEGMTDLTLCELFLLVDQSLLVVFTQNLVILAPSSAASPR